MNETVVNLANARLQRQAVEDLTQVMKECMREAVEQIAIVHGGMSQDWVDRKTAAVVSIMEAMIDVSSQGVHFSSAVSMSAEDQATFQRDLVAALSGRDHGFMAAFAAGLTELLGP